MAQRGPHGNRSDLARDGGSMAERPPHHDWKGRHQIVAVTDRRAVAGAQPVESRIGPSIYVDNESAPGVSSRGALLLDWPMQIQPARRISRSRASRRPPAGIAGAFSGFSVTSASVVRMMPATDAAFSSAERVTLAGSMMPASTRSTYCLGHDVEARCSGSVSCRSRSSWTIDRALEAGVVHQLAGRLLERPLEDLDADLHVRLELQRRRAPAPPPAAPRRRRAPRPPRPPRGSPGAHPRRAPSSPSARPRWPRRP